MEAVCERKNCEQALARVKSNKGSAGIDGMTVEQLPDYLKKHWPTPKAVARFKQRVRELTRRTRGVKVETMVAQLSRYLLGWRGYFGKLTA